MPSVLTTFPRPLLYALAGLSFCVVVAAGYLGWRTYTLARERAALSTELASSTRAYLAETTDLQAKLADETASRISLEGQLTHEQERADAIAIEARTSSSTAAALQKRIDTDAELLKKYSKVYFLNENYVPLVLAPIPSEYNYEKTRVLKVQGQVEPRLEQLLKDAHDDGQDILVISAYRSFDTQAGLKSSYRVTYGAGTANSFSADQGYSEHQLGTALDFTTTKVGTTFAGFDKTGEYAWLTDNAWKYGFILSYPPKNAYYQYEPWHWRFVGTALAQKLHDDDEYFYELDQREIDGYLGTLFD
ncbi:MAG: M15 family metallopeptidase [Patescibacteria group bacterium]